MLVLERKLSEIVRIGNDISVMVVAIGKGWVKLGFAAPADVRIDREEVRRAKDKQDDQ